MRSSHSPDRIETAFDDEHLVADAGLLLPATLAHHLGLKALVEEHLDLGRKPGRANVGDKLLTLVASALAGGDSIDDAGALGAGGTGRVLGFTVKAPSTLGTFLRSFRWGHVRQLDRVSRLLLARAWAAGAGPGAGPLTIDLDLTICETYGLQKEGARHHGYTGVRGYHPLLAVAAGTGDVLMARLREGRANTARGAAHFLRETIGRVRDAGASGQLTLRADSGFYTHEVVRVCRAMGVRFSITVRLHRGLHQLIEAIPENAWSPIPYWLEGGADVAETSYTPFAGEKGAQPARLIVRRVKPTPGSQLALFTAYDYHAFITDRAGDTLALEADHRRHAELENAIRDLEVRGGVEPPALGPLRRQWRLAGRASAGPQPGALDRPHGTQGGHRHHQDAAPAAVQPRRAADPLGSPLDAPPADPLALGGRVHYGPRPPASAPAPSLTPPRTARLARGLAGACPPPHRTRSRRPVRASRRRCETRQRPVGSSRPLDQSTKRSCRPSAGSVSRSLGGSGLSRAASTCRRSSAWSCLALKGSTFDAPSPTSDRRSSRPTTHPSSVSARSKRSPGTSQSRRRKPGLRCARLSEWTTAGSCGGFRNQPTAFATVPPFP